MKTLELQEFTNYLVNKNLSEDKISFAMNQLNSLNKFLINIGKTLETAGYDDLYRYSDHLIENNFNTFDTYLSLLRYGYFTNNTIYIQVFLEILDGREMIENFSTQLISKYGSAFRDQIFKDIAIPPLGIKPVEKPYIVKILVNRLIERIGIEECEIFFRIGLRDKYIDSYKPARERYLKTQDIDSFLLENHTKLVNTLEKHNQEKSLFFTQEVDDTIVEVVRNDQTIESGIRKGNKIRITKIPYQAKQFYAESDEKMRRFYYCHNPWIRHALKNEEKPIDPVFCNCSGAYFKNYWEFVLDSTVQVDVVKSVIKGDNKCEFNLIIPNNVLKT